MSSETDSVHLGSGFYCTQAGFTAMETAKNDCDWTVALLVGVFGEDAKLMRVYPRKPGLKKFPLGFLMLAQNLYRQRLKDSNYEADIDEAVKSLPAYLADRALDLEGGRNITSRAKRFKKSNNDNYILKRKKAAVSSAVLTATAPTSTVPLTSQSPSNVKEKKRNFNMPPF
ncbi:uncharacterized protein LOC112459121 [Temnothorax curvispinosus]|uniref:Uncharacterized protein LOC112459121 n=1 Tax=Temnothorax curvispinosus TaxID=300111 RepID=A0A6J1QDR4_9HYME|nr:uncharacterized protein LOC112459121 [Temnothorax curvispinosus]